LSGALHGIKVIDLSRVLAGPFCTMILGDLGAEIIKVESPNGDDTRHWGPPFKNDVSAYYLCANRNKKSITINLKTEKGIDTIINLIKDADVVIHNFKTGTMDRFGLDYESLEKINPQLVYCSITGFGETGPFKDLPGYDFIIQAMSGLMSITGTEQSGPQKVGVAMTDVVTGLYAAIGIQAALIERLQSQRGQKVDLSLYDSAVSTLVNIGSNYLMNGDIPGRLGNSHANIVPYESFKTKDGEIVIAVGNDLQFIRFCSILQVDDLANDPRFQTNKQRVSNRDQLIPIVQQKLKERSTDYWHTICIEAKIPCGPIQYMDDVYDDPQLKEREMFIEAEHPIAGNIKMIGSPLKLSRTPVSYRQHPPIKGEHNDKILK